MYYCDIFVRCIIDFVLRVLLQVRYYLCIVLTFMAKRQVYGRTVDIDLLAYVFTINLP